MTTYQTGNPIGSTDPRDLYDNAENLDTAVNDTNLNAWSDRLGRSRKTMSGMEAEFNADQTERASEFDADQTRRESVFNASQIDRQDRFNNFIASSGYQFLGDYAAGIEITEYNQIVRDADGEFWRLSGQVELPYTTTGAGLPEGDALTPLGDAVLRQQLDDVNQGAALIGRGVLAVDSIADLLALPPGQRRSGLRYLVKGYHAGTGVGGGEFWWDAACERSSHDGGVVLSPDAIWDGTYSGLSEFFESGGQGVGCFIRIRDGSCIDVDWFGATEDDDLSVILSHIKEFGVITGGRSYSWENTVPLGTQGITLQGLIATKNSSGEMLGASDDVSSVRLIGCELAGVANANVFQVKSAGTVIGDVNFSNCVITGFRYAVRADGTQDTVFGTVTLKDNKISEGVGGFQFYAKGVSSLIATDNLFENLTRSSDLMSGTATALAAGGNDWEFGQGRMVAANNVFRNISGYGGEIHAIQLHGEQVTVTGNVVDRVENTSTNTKDVEAIYIKGRKATITGNTIIDGGYTTDGALNIKGGSRGVVCTGNYIYFSDGVGRFGNGISISTPNVLCSSNFVENCPNISIQVALDEGSDVVVKGNTIIGGGKDESSSSASAAISVAGAESFITVAGNVIRDSYTSGVLVRMPSSRTRIENVSVRDNLIHLRNGLDRSGVLTIGTADATFHELSIERNDIHTDAGRPINLSVTPSYSNLSVLDNEFESHRNDMISIPPASSLSGSLRVRNMNCFVMSSGGTVTPSRASFSRILASNPLSLSTPALVGNRVSISSRSDTMNISTSMGVFRGGFGTLQMQEVGGLDIECIEEGVWDVVGATVPVIMS